MKAMNMRISETQKEKLTVQTRTKHRKRKAIQKQQEAM